ncbi:hypothetical protein SCP_1103040 [Sparassis crispa]|uniref:Microbial-type PARG catalytic domain-containing protein n=1 Tax=Sparassis crispa TaxID=139825 RepID=A0A401GZN4_9APHY|nr:hypothetical protein SCP_1103040 [Sparassis crispa]GBE87627.1 hypothetical protein SCP_1103040 [Sparassis crispa]
MTNTFDKRRRRLKEIAESTLEAIEQGSFSLNNVTHDLNSRIVRAKKNTRYYAPDSLLSRWSSLSPPWRSPQTPTKVSLLETSTLEGARWLSATHSGNRPASDASAKIAILNFASAKKPGGGFKSGAQAQEESIARSSTLYPTLMTRTGQEFYTLHHRDQKGGYYSHAMIYSPGVTVFRDDGGGWVEPLDVDVLTSAAVNAGVARHTLHGRVAGPAVEGKIEKAMRERMARILYLFESNRATSIVLGSFGTGVFRNNVAVVANIWADLLLSDGARFKDSFDHVAFAILGKPTFEEFQKVFEDRRKSGPDGSDSADQSKFEDT